MSFPQSVSGNPDVRQNILDARLKTSGMTDKRGKVVRDNAKEVSSKQIKLTFNLNTNEGKILILLI